MWEISTAAARLYDSARTMSNRGARSAWRATSKEWVWNELNGQRYILGGAWNEPVYMAVADDLRPPTDRAAMNGFRCVKEYRAVRTRRLCGVRRLPRSRLQ